jgi:hypothetical protein
VVIAASFKVSQSACHSGGGKPRTLARGYTISVTLACRIRAAQISFVPYR